MSAEQKAGAPSAKPAATGLSAVAAGTGAPGWLFPLYVGGLALVFMGERVLSGLEKGAGIVTALGVIAMALATLFRFSPKFRAQGERGAIERLIAVLSIVGLLALALYYVTTDSGAERFGLAKMTSEKRDHAIELLRVVWVSLLSLAVIPQLFAEFALRPMRRAERPEARRVKAAAMAGGALEYISLITGYRALLIVVGVLYGLAFATGLRKRVSPAVT